MIKIVAPVVVSSLLAVGCVDPFNGSHIEFTLTGVKPLCQLVGDLPTTLNLASCKSSTDFPTTDDDTTAYYLELWAVLHRSTLVRLKTFTIQRSIKPEEVVRLEQRGVQLPSGKPFQIDPRRALPKNKTFNELSKDSEWAALFSLLNKLTSVSTVSSYAPSMFQDGSKRVIHPDYYIGGFDPITLPRNGVFYGVVDGMHPIGFVAIGGAEFDVEVVLDDLSELFITIESKPPDRSKPAPSEAILLSGSMAEVVQGALSVEAKSKTIPGVVGHFNVYTNLTSRDWF